MLMQCSVAAFTFLKFVDPSVLITRLPKLQKLVKTEFSSHNLLTEVYFSHAILK